MEKQEVLDNLTYYSRCLCIVALSRKKDVLEKKHILSVTRDSATNRIINELLKFLEENEFISVDKERIPFIYYIDGTKLADFLCKSQWYNKFGAVVELRTKIIPYSY